MEEAKAMLTLLYRWAHVLKNYKRSGRNWKEKYVEMNGWDSKLVEQSLWHCLADLNMEYL